MKPSKLPTGIFKTKTGYRTFVRVRGELKSETWDRNTTIQRMKEWREEQRVRIRIGAALPPSDTTFAEDVKSYLQQRKTMPTLKWRTQDLKRWVTVFGADRDRRTITAGEIRTQLETWRKAGYAANTVNHRRTALMHLFTVLDGKSAKNIVRDVPRYRDESLEAPPRALSAVALALILDEMPHSLAKVRLSLMAWTGWPQAQILRLEPKDVRWNDAVRLTPRRKGKGAAGVWLPLLPEAWAALHAYKASGAWGGGPVKPKPTRKNPYSWRDSARGCFRRAAERVRATVMLPLSIWTELEDVTPYQMRHSFGSLVAAVTKDDRAVQTLMQHSDIRTTHRYTESTADPRAVAALGLVSGVTSQLHNSVSSE